MNFFTGSRRKRKYAGRLKVVDQRNYRRGALQGLE